MSKIRVENLCQKFFNKNGEFSFYNGKVPLFVSYLKKKNNKKLTW